MSVRADIAVQASPAALAPPLQSAAAAEGVAARAAYLREVHLLRGIAICLIVLLHTLPSFDWSRHGVADAFIHGLLDQTSILFFFVSGYLFQHLSGRFGYGAYLKRKARNVLLPYLIVSLPALVVALFFIPQTSLWPWVHDLPVALQAAMLLLTGKHLEPLWFIPTLVLLFLAAPLLLAIDRRPRLYLLLPALLLLAAYVGPNGPTGPLHKSLFFAPVYLAGMWVSRYRARIDAAVERHMAPALLLLCALYFLTVPAMVEDKPLDPALFFKLASCPVLLVVLKRVSRPLPLLDLAAAWSFAIYFLHGYVLAAFRLLYTHAQQQGWEGDPALFAPSPWGIALHFAAVLGVSLLAVACVRRLFPGRSRWIVGA
jgi:probable poly-beta-1,6-N-acetyl-D-glucosamine export protein